MIFGIGAIHFETGNPQDEYAGDDDIQLDQYEVAAMKGMAFHISTRRRPKSCTVSEAFEEQKRLVVPVHDEADQKDSKRTLSLMDLLNWDYCSDMAWPLLQSGQNDRRAHETSATESK